MPIKADTSAEKTALRKALLANRQNISAGIRLGIIIAHDVENSAHLNFAAEAESALRLLDDEAIEELDNQELAAEARRAKAAVYARLLLPEKTAEYGNPDGSGSSSGGFGTDIEMPYYIDIGGKFETPDSILMPFTGIGLTKSAFSSMLSANAGLKYFRSSLGLKLQWVQTAIPDFSCFDYAFAESYALGEAAFSHNGNVLRLGAAAGKRLFAEESGNYFDLKQLAFTAAGTTENVKFELMLFNDGLNKLSAEIDCGLQQIPERGHNSWSMELSMPLSFDFAYFELGFLPRFFHTAETAGSAEGASASVNIGKRHYIYENAIMPGKNPESLNYRYYETMAAVDAVFRLFAFPFSAPADRIYLGLNASAGIGADDAGGQTDILCSAGFSAGFDLDDNIPFEIRFGFDQDGYSYIYMTVVNRISHPF